MTLLELSRSQILSFRRRVGSLDERLPPGAKSLRRAAWAGLQDSMPRAALLSIHARVHRASSNTWEHPSLVQLWGPRFSGYVVAAQDLPVFSLGRLPEDALRRARAHDTASRLHAFLDGRRMPFGQAGHGMGVQPNSLRYAAQTGTVVLRWDGARQATIWTAPAPDMDPQHARIELARRFLHIFGPATAPAFAKWGGLHPTEARAAFQALAKTRTSVRTPIGDAWILTDDVAKFQSPSGPPAPARLLPAAIRTTCCGAPIESSWYPKSSGRPPYGPLVSGQARCPRTNSQSNPGAAFPPPNKKWSRPRTCHYLCPASMVR